MMSTFFDCRSCRRCEGSGQLVSPIYYLGNELAPVLVVGQNPGWFKPGDFSGWVHDYETAEDEDEVYVQSSLDFMGTGAERKLSWLLGKDWLQSDKFCYTNAVRCRTPQNATPSKEMVLNCYFWTEQLLFGIPRRFVLCLGSVAWQQVFTNRLERGMRERYSLPSVAKYRPIRSSRTGTIYLWLDHFVLWRSEHINQAREPYNQIMKEISK